MQITQHQDRIIRSERIPKIALFAGNRFDGPIIIEVPPINKNFNYWYVGVGVKYNFASLYKTNKSVSRSKYSVQRVREQYEDAKEQTELAVVLQLSVLSTGSTRDKIVVSGLTLIAEGKPRVVVRLLFKIVIVF